MVTAVATVANLVAALVDPQTTGIVVGLGQTLSNLAAAVVGFVLLRRWLGPLRLRSTMRMYVRLAVAALVAGAVTLGVVTVLGAALPTLDGGPTWLGALVELVVGLGVLFAVFLPLAHALRCPKLSSCSTRCCAGSDAPWSPLRRHGLG